MSTLKPLFESNRIWSETMTKRQADFFAQLSAQQTPRYFWIGCSDSRVPANQIVALEPGDMFVHRNVANIVVHTDLNCLSAIQFAVDTLKIQDIIVCGHYGCGGVLAALRNDRLGLIDNWLRHVQDVYIKHRQAIDAVSTEEMRHNRLCELNVTEQVLNVCQTTVVQDAWSRGQEVSVHGLIYGLRDGLLQDLNISIASENELRAQLQKNRR